MIDLTDTWHSEVGWLYFALVQQKCGAVYSTTRDLALVAVAFINQMSCSEYYKENNLSIELFHDGTALLYFTNCAMLKLRCVSINQNLVSIHAEVVAETEIPLQIIWSQT